MTVRIDDQLHVLGLETKPADVRIDERRRLLEAAIEQDMSGITGDQNRRQSVGPDVVAVAENPERLARFVPLIAARALVRWIGFECRRLKGGDKKQDQTGQLHIPILTFPELVRK